MRKTFYFATGIENNGTKKLVHISGEMTDKYISIECFSNRTIVEKEKEPDNYLRLSRIFGQIENLKDAIEIILSPL